MNLPKLLVHCCQLRINLFSPRFSLSRPSVHFGDQAVNGKRLIRWVFRINYISNVTRVVSPLRAGLPPICLLVCLLDFASAGVACEFLCFQTKQRPSVAAVR
jgi:hypothetical protein